MNLYEKVLIIDPNLDDSTAEDTLNKVIDLITKKGGEILRIDRWGRRKLAYILNKRDRGNYFIILFKAPPTTIPELERLCRVTDAIFKFMVVKFEKKRHIEAVMASLKKGNGSPSETSEQTDTEVKEGVQ